MREIQDIVDFLHKDEDITPQTIYVLEAPVMVSPGWYDVGAGHWIFKCVEGEKEAQAFATEVRCGLIDRSIPRRFRFSSLWRTT